MPFAFHVTTRASQCLGIEMNTPSLFLDQDYMRDLAAISDLHRIMSIIRHNLISERKGNVSIQRAEQCWPLLASKASLYIHNYVQESCLYPLLLGGIHQDEQNFPETMRNSCVQTSIAAATLPVIRGWVKGH